MNSRSVTIGIGLLVLLTGATGALVLLVGLNDANMVSGVISMALAVVGLGVSIYGVRRPAAVDPADPPPPLPAPDTPPSPEPDAGGSSEPSASGDVWNVNVHGGGPVFNGPDQVHHHRYTGAATSATDNPPDQTP